MHSVQELLYISPPLMDLVSPVGTESRGPFKSWSSNDARCHVKGTAWSECSKSCGIGLSTRLSLHKSRCQLKKETRLCQIRPCSLLEQLHPKEGTGCLKSHKERVPKPFVYKGCNSIKNYSPKYCGMCWDRRCCRPSETRTTKVRFQCPGSGTLVMMVAKIKKCECTRPKGQSRGCAQVPLVTNIWKRSLWDLAVPQPHA
ncbi:CCN family member 1-like [Narcine bancroftii]|uniref:CCN family member 1-like n=1 Tax=Narcine bancroftii TaxID=1343680 RepID=UPI003831BE58